MKKIISLDLDGTLLNAKKQVSRRNVNTILECKKLGHEVIFATARPKRAVINVLPKEILDGVLICYNGSVIYENDKKIYENIIDKKTVEGFVLGFSKKYIGSFVGIETDAKLYSNNDARVYFGEVENNLIDLESFNYSDTAKLIIGMEKILDIEELKQLIPENCKIVITDKGTIGQISSKNVSKLSGVEQIIKRKHMKMKDVIAFGDDYNDVELIAKSGVGVAMGNAVQELKDIADYVTETNKNDGVAEFLDKYFNL